MASYQRRFTSEDYTSRHADVFARRYDDGLRAVKVAALRRFLGNIEHRDVLDLGCGIGYFAALCTDLGARTVACDFAESMVNCTVQRYGSQFPVVRASAQNPPFRPAGFDVILALDLIEHLYKPLDMLRQVNSLLKPDGRLLIITDRPGFQIAGIPKYVFAPCRWLLRRVGLKVGGRPGRARYRTPLCTHVEEYRPTELINLARRAGFQLARLDTFPNQAALGPFGYVVDCLAKGALKKYKFDHAIYEFTKGPCKKAQGGAT